MCGGRTHADSLDSTGEGSEWEYVGEEEGEDEEDGEDWEYQEELELPRKELQGPYCSQQVQRKSYYS